MKELAIRINERLKGKGLQGLMSRECIRVEDYEGLVTFWSRQIKEKRTNDTKIQELLGDKIINEIVNLKK